MTSPESLAIGGAAIAAPIPTGVGLAAHGLYNMYESGFGPQLAQAAQNRSFSELSPEAAERFLSGGAEAAGGAATGLGGRAPGATQRAAKAKAQSFAEAKHALDRTKRPKLPSIP